MAPTDPILARIDRELAAVRDLLAHTTARDVRQWTPRYALLLNALHDLTEVEGVLDLAQEVAADRGLMLDGDDLVPLDPDAALYAAADYRADLAREVM